MDDEHYAEMEELSRQDDEPVKNEKVVINKFMDSIKKASTEASPVASNDEAVMGKTTLASIAGLSETSLSSARAGVSNAIERMHEDVNDANDLGDTGENNEDASKKDKDDPEQQQKGYGGSGFNFDFGMGKKKPLNLQGSTATEQGLERFDGSDNPKLLYKVEESLIQLEKRMGKLEGNPLVSSFIENSHAIAEKNHVSVNDVLAALKDENQESVISHDDFLDMKDDWSKLSKSKDFNDNIASLRNQSELTSMAVSELNTAIHEEGLTIDSDSMAELNDVVESIEAIGDKFDFSELPSIGDGGGIDGAFDMEDNKKLFENIHKMMDSIKNMAANLAAKLGF